METTETPQLEDIEDAVDSEKGRQFLQQLRDAHPTAIEGVVDVLHTWTELGGRLSFGRASETSRFLNLDANQSDGSTTWPMAIYPKTGTIEVVFQHMRRRPVFDDVALRDEFRQRLLSAGIVIPESKLNLRPSFRVDLLADPDASSAVKAALEWFAMVFKARIAKREQGDGPKASDVLGVL